MCAHCVEGYEPEGEFDAQIKHLAKCAGAVLLIRMAGQLEGDHFPAVMRAADSGLTALHSAGLPQVNESAHSVLLP